VLWARLETAISRLQVRSFTDGTKFLGSNMLNMLRENTKIKFMPLLTFSVRHLNAIKSTAGRSFLGIKPLPALQQM
jgi:hypothetical protein